MSYPSADPTDRIKASSFGRDPSTYEAGRPSYPDEAVDWLLKPLPDGSTVADIGAGTGKLTRALVDRGFKVVAVDHDQAMLDELSANLPQVETIEAKADQLPFGNSSLDAAVFGQAWHWVDPKSTSIELGRVLRPKGTLGLVWNVRDERVDWIAELTNIIYTSAAERLITLDQVRVTPPLGPLSHVSIEWSRPMNRDQILSMVRSRSNYLVADPARQKQIETDLANLLDRLGLNDDATIDFPYTTHAFRSLSSKRL